MISKSLFLLVALSALANGADLRTQSLAFDKDIRMQGLAQAQSKAEDVVIPADFEPIYETDDPYGIALMMLGVLFVPLS